VTFLLYWQRSTPQKCRSLRSSAVAIPQEPQRNLIRLTQWWPVVVQALTRVMMLAAMETGSAMSHNHDHGRPLRTSCSQQMSCVIRALRGVVIWRPTIKMMMGIHPKQARGFIDFLHRLLSCVSLLPHVSQRATSDPITFPRGLQRMPASKSSVPPKVPFRPERDWKSWHTLCIRLGHSPTRLRWRTASPV
jgi:hypothetical protein